MATKKTPTKKEIAFDPKSRRQLWQAYQHALKAHEWAKACWQVTKKENDQAMQKNPKQAEIVLRAVEIAYNNCMVESWVLINRIKKISEKKFNQDIKALEVYK